MQYHREKEINPKLDTTSYLNGQGELGEGGAGSRSKVWN